MKTQQTETTHSPLPWKHLLPDQVRGPEGEFVADCSCNGARLTRDNANAALIVEAVNSHARLTEENRRLREALAMALAQIAQDNNDRDVPGEYRGTEHQARAALGENA